MCQTHETRLSSPQFLPDDIVNIQSCKCKKKNSHHLDFTAAKKNAPISKHRSSRHRNKKFIASLTTIFIPSKEILHGDDDWLKLISQNQMCLPMAIKKIKLGPF